jgi:hypothetical protein
MKVFETAVSPTPYRRWLLLILLTAVFLRLYAITDAPPGLTHDEADHGITAWEIVNGMRGVYFTIGYGREPLFDYATAGLMSLIGPTYLAVRLTAVYASLLMIAGMAAWIRRAFDAPTALLTAAGLAVGFWPVMAGRQALRSIMLPALFALAVLLWWQGMERLKINDSRLKVNLKSSIINLFFAGLLLGGTFYTYIPARVMWGVFPVVLLFAALWQRPFFRQVWVGTAVMLVIAFLTASPLFLYLAANPAVEVRIDELSVPLAAAAEGNFQPLLRNATASLRLFSVEGDSTWRYNIPGRPFLQPVMGILFYAGIIIALLKIIQNKDQAARGSFLALAWLAAGLSPVLVTGPELSMTQAIGMQPVLYLFPALTLVAAADLVMSRGAGVQRSWGDAFSPLLPRSSALLLILSVLILYLATAVSTYRAYFINWANAPEVRVQYEATMVAAMDYLNELGAGETAVSTITPHAYHSPAIARLTLYNENVNLHWFDGQRSLLLPPDEESTIILPGFTPLPPPLAAYFDTAVLIDSLPLRPTDEDRPLDIYRVNGAAMRADWQEQFTTETAPIDFGGAVIFLGYELITVPISSGELVQVATLWQVERPLPGAVLFTHLLGDDGQPIAQADRLDVPGELWQAGDWFIQLHEFVVPVGTAVGDYPLTVGVYTCPGGVPCPDGQRLTTSTGQDTHLLTQLSVKP